MRKRKRKRRRRKKVRWSRSRGRVVRGGENNGIVGGKGSRERRKVEGK